MVKTALNHATQKGKIENIITLKNGHLNQTDFAAIMAFELSILMFKWPKTWFADLYLLNSKLALSFIDRLDKEREVKSYFDPSKANEKIKELESEFIKYDIKFG